MTDNDQAPIELREEEIRRIVDEQVNIATDDLRWTIRELKHYKIVFRILLFAILSVVLGGSIWTIWELQGYVDKRIVTQIQRMDNLYIAVNYGSSDNFDDALALLETFWADYKSSKVQLSIQGKSFLNLNTLWILSNFNKGYSSGRPGGEEMWKTLLADDTFRSEFLVGNKWYFDPYVCKNLAICYLKYGGSENDLEEAEQFLIRSLKHSEIDEMRANLLLNLSAFDFVQNRLKNSKEKLLKVNSLNQREYRLRDLQLYTNRIVDDNVFKSLLSCAERTKQLDKVQLLKDFLEFLKTINVDH